MPTFLLYKGGQKVGDVVGANPQAVEVSPLSHGIVRGPLTHADFRPSFRKAKAIDELEEEARQAWSQKGFTMYMYFFCNGPSKLSKL